MRVAEEADAESTGDARINGLHPVHDAPVTEYRGGVLYHAPESAEEIEQFIKTAQFMGAPVNLKEYAVFVSHSEAPARDRFVVQCKLVPFYAFDLFYYGADPEKLEGGETPQALTLGEFFRDFIHVQRQRWNECHVDEMGGDETWSLGFGFFMENPYNHACRIWSRPWLVQK